MASIMWVLALLSTCAIAQDTPPPDPGPNYDYSLTINNITPYDFILTNTHSYDIGNWDNAWPTRITAGSVFTCQYGLGGSSDDGADVSYQLDIQGQTKGFSLHAQGKGGANGVTITGSYTGAFTCNGNPTGLQNFQIGDFTSGPQNPGAADAWIVVGDEIQGYICNNPPAGWMSYLGDPFKALTMRQAVMPASHDSGMSQINGNAGDFSGDAANTKTQYISIYEQLVLGVRWFDWRPYTTPDTGQTIYLGHFTAFASGSVGNIGQSLTDAMADIVRFQNEHPGELIVLDTAVGGQYTHETTVRDWAADEWKLYFTQMSKGIPQLNQVYSFPNTASKTDVTTLPLSFWFKNTPNPVLCRNPTKDPVSSVTPKPPGALDSYGFLGIPQLPYSGSYSNTEDPNYEKTDQQNKLATYRTSPNDEISMNSFTYTLQGGDVIDGSIESGTPPMHEIAYDNLFRWSTAKSYPNLLNTDFIADTDMLTLAIALNMKFGYQNLPLCT